ncbi:MAG: P-loop NTPase, partial [Halobacteriales archaeon]|nr:P-loop NTPase [Halobacteriales archaeon]
NVPNLLRIAGPIQADEQDRPLPVRRGSLEVLSVGLMSDGGPLAWRGAMAHDAVADLIQNARWRAGGAMVVDLPPGTGDVALTTLESLAVDGVVLVTTPFETSVEDTRRSIELFRENGVPVLGVIVNMAHFSCDCGRDHDLFLDDATHDLTVPVLARLPFAPSFQADPRPGEVPAAFTDLVGIIEDRLAAVRDPVVPIDAVDIRGCTPSDRVDRVREAFLGRDTGDILRVVSDRDPTPAGDFLVDLCDASGTPQDVFGTFSVEQRAPEMWVLMVEVP